MTKIGLIFPGQGSQYVGMGKDFYDNYPVGREILDKANEVLGFDLKKIIFEGPEETLRQTQYTQPAIFAVSYAIFKVFAVNCQLSTVLPPAILSESIRLLRPRKFSVLKTD
ncbi:MAG: acyltransferase domain-containing protein [Elusimicrobiota bacterium]